MLTVTLYTKKDCHLCEQARADLAALQEQVPHQLVEIDIESDPALHQKYLVEVPVVHVGPYHKAAPFNRQDLLITLSAARDRQASLERLGEPEYLARVKRGQEISGTDRFSFAFSQNYIWVINLVMLLYIGLPFLAPVLMKSGYTAPAKVIYTVYSSLCHQLGFRSFFLYGPQDYYPRAAAGIDGVATFGQATGLNEDDLWAARSFTGTEQVGYKVALCERDIAIYGAILLFGILFALAGRRIPSLHWIAWLLIGIAPIGFDGFSQLLSQAIPQLNAIIPYRESTPLLRVITGGLFGFTTAWFGFPYIEESMRDARALLVKKFAVVDKVKSL